MASTRQTPDTILADSFIIHVVCKHGSSTNALKDAILKVPNEISIKLFRASACGRSGERLRSGGKQAST